MEDILSLYVPEGAAGCDVTYGKGKFWSDAAKAHVGGLLATDLAQDGTDLADLPYGDESQDFHVMDPPYMCGFFRPSHEKTAAMKTHSDFKDRYGHHVGGGYKGRYYHAALSLLYKDGLAEAWRVLRKGGIQITKCMDEVSSHTQYLTHVEIVNEAERLGFRVKDLFVVVRADKPHGKLIKRQEHARKNHSYFLVFQKPKRLKTGE